MEKREGMDETVGERMHGGEAHGLEIVWPSLDGHYRGVLVN